MNLQEQLNSYKNQFYSDNKKNSFFKSKQKLDCATVISKKIPIEQLLINSIYIIPNSSFIYIDYPILKHFLCPETYNAVSEHILQLNKIIVKVYGHFNIRVDLKSFTITAAQRYSDLIQKFCGLYLNETEQSNNIQTIQIYNRPTVMEVLLNMFSPFISKESRDKVEFIKQN
jgi:hypothetical protein